MKLKLDLKEADEVLRTILNAINDMTPLLHDIGQEMVDSTLENFQEGTSPDGIPWAPKSKATLEKYERRKDGPVSSRPLIGPSKTLSSRQVHSFGVGDGKVSWGTNLTQAAVMQFGAAKGTFGTAANGSSIPWGDIPARPFIGIGEDDISEIVRLAEEHLDPNR